MQTIHPDSHVTLTERRVCLKPFPKSRQVVSLLFTIAANNEHSFILYQLRTGYLGAMRDGVGERLITVNSSVLNNPAFRLAGWTPAASDIKRTYSPPIPTATAAEYFQGPRTTGLSGANFGDDDEEGGMVTGGGGSNETVGPLLNSKRKRRKEQLDEDDSSDLSDESDEDGDGTQRAAQQIKFNKMPLRSRAGSSPLRSANLLDGPSVLVTSPSKPEEHSQLRRGSSSTVDSSQPVDRFRGRVRRDTTTSSDLSSENELDPSLFQRKQLNPRKPRPAMLAERIQEEEREGEVDLNEVDAAVDSDESSLSSELAGSEDSATSILEHVGDPSMSLPSKPPGFQSGSTPPNSSPKRARPREQPPLLQALPPPRPISIMVPVSALSQALKAWSTAPSDPFERFATLSGNGETNPLYIKIYVPGTPREDRPLELLVRRIAESNASVPVAEVIGYALWKYEREGVTPEITGAKKNVNRWNFRIYEDGDIDYDFPPLARMAPVSDFTSNNNRPPRLRARDKPWDEFALVEASEKEFKENESLTPKYSKEASDAQAVQSKPAPGAMPSPLPPTPADTFTRNGPYRNPITDPGFSAAAQRKETLPLDAPAVPVAQSAPRFGAPKSLTIHFTDDKFVHRTTMIEVTTDTYIADVFDAACKRFNVEKALYNLKVHGTSTVAPTDRTVEALGSLAILDLVRRRFIGDGAFGLSGSPGSTGSPNAPLFGTPRKTGTGKVTGTANTATTAAAAKGAQNLAALQRQEALLAAAAVPGKRYAVIRKQPMSFASSSARIIVFDADYMHIMPAAATGGLDPVAVLGGGKAGIFGEAPQKVTSVLFANVVGSKVSRRHPRCFSFGVYRERETKRYDFEAQTQEEAVDIVGEIKKGVEKSRVEVGM